MKKIILIIFASLMFANIGFAGIRLIETEIVEWGKTLGPSKISTLCIDNYKFVIIKGSGTRAVSSGIVQFYEVRNDFLLPAEC